MNKNIATFPLTEAFRAGDECPFCNLERSAEQHAISFILGSAYMEDDIRAATDAIGFCRHHYKMMYDYGNRLGSAWILSTHMKKLNEELTKELKDFTPGKTSMLGRMKKTDMSGADAPQTSIGNWVKKKTDSCYVCNHFNEIYGRYLDVFFDMLKKDAEFQELFRQSKGFCLPHFGDLMEAAEKRLNDAQKKDLYPLIFSMMQENMERVQKDVAWFVEKNDYRNKDKDWGQSRDSIQRAMQKCAGGYPADPVFKLDP